MCRCSDFCGICLALVCFHRKLAEMELHTFSTHRLVSTIAPCELVYGYVGLVPVCRLPGTCVTHTRVDLYSCSHPVYFQKQPGSATLLSPCPLEEQRRRCRLRAGPLFPSLSHPQIGPFSYQIKYCLKVGVFYKTVAIFFFFEKKKYSKGRESPSTH